jgi:hypothetical protein
MVPGSKFVFQFGVQGSGFGVQGSGFKVPGSMFRPASMFPCAIITEP